jgi:hypothetical protein
MFALPAWIQGYFAPLGNQTIIQQPIKTPQLDQSASPLEQKIAEQFSKTYATQPDILNFETSTVELKRKWVSLVGLCQSFGSSAFASISDAEMNSIFLGKEIGLCTATILHYFGKFFRFRSPQWSSPFALKTIPYVDAQSRVKFYPFAIYSATLEKQTRMLRFLQASYKIAYALKKDPLKLVPPNMLKKEHLQIVKRIPDPDAQHRLSFEIKELLPELRKLASQSSSEGYLLALAGPINHSLGIYLQDPFHFIDPSNGIGIAQSSEDLILFLASYLAEKFSNYRHFALLELAPGNPIEPQFSS